MPKISLHQLTLAFCLFFCSLNSSFAQQREVFSFDKEWKFYKGDIPFPEIRGHGESYANAKAGKAWGAAAPEYNDNSWRTLNLPHDWAVENSFDSTENVSQGFRERGYGWYRKKFKLNPQDKGKHLELQFEGIATFATVWFNGSVVHRNWCGYTSFYIDLTSMAKYGDDVNTVVVRVDANAMEGWWYEGAGIYRKTWLVKRNPVHITTDGVFANPVKTSATNWNIPVEVELNNSGYDNQKVTAQSTLIDPAGKEIATNQTSINIGPLKTGLAKFELSVSHPQLWDLETPNRYKVVTVVKQGNTVIDKVTTTCGFRTLRFDKDTGFYLNDKNIKIQGVCNHQDHAGLGVALPDAIWAFRLKKLKEMGVNAYRCSHNPPPVTMLNLCDSLGILVMDENRNFNVSPEYMRQLEWLVKRDRNHPSIILWSVFNEEPMQGTEQGYEMVRRMASLVKSMDSTRPVTAAMNGGLFTPKNVSDAVDVVGFNYQIWAYDRFRKENPNKILTSSEDISSFQIRGEYKTDRKKNIVDDYDTEAAPWGATQRTGWKAIAERPWLAGSFIWTGFDYRGEPTPFVWPTAGSVFGLMDLCGFPKNAYYIKQAQWRHDKPILNLAPHWNWPKDSVGKTIKVMVSSNVETVELKLNGKLLGKQQVDKYEMNTFLVPFSPGKLEAIGYKSGKIAITNFVQTTGKPVALKLAPYTNTLDNNGLDAMPVTVTAVDAKGRDVPTANLMVDFDINTNGYIIGLGNGNPNSHEAEKGKKRSLFNGLAQVIVQAVEGAKGNVVLTATAKGLKPASLKIALRNVPSQPFIAAAKPALLLSDFRMAPISKTKPNAKQTLSDNDMNSWEAIKTGQAVRFQNGTFAMFSTNFLLQNIKTPQAKLLLEKVIGKAEIWLNDKLIYTKTDEQTGNIDIPFTAANGKQKLVIVVEAPEKSQAGLAGKIVVLAD